MNTNIPRLTQSKTGFYSYRRKIKEAHRHLFEGKRELKKSFDTKDLRHALRLHKDMDRWFDSILATEGHGLDISPEVAPKQKVVEVIKDLKNRNLHPTDQPKLDVTASPAGFMRFMESITEAIPVILAQDKLTDEEVFEVFEELKKKGNSFVNLLSYRMEVNSLKKRLQSRYGDVDMVGLMAKPSSRNPKQPWDSGDPDVIKYKIMTGDPELTPDPTWSDAMYAYLKHNLDKPRNADTAQKWKNAVISLCQRLSIALPLGMKTRLDALDFTLLRDFVNDTWSNAATRGKNLRTYAAILNNWNKMYPEQAVINHFSVLVADNNSKEERDTKVRRSFTPDEHAVFMRQLLDNTDPEIKTIGLIMEAYGAPTGEAACLLREDIKLKVETPHLIIRNNKYRVLGKKRLERALPIIEPLLSHLKGYIDNHFTGSGADLLFPRFGSGTHASGDRSKKLSALVENQRPDDDALLSPYSLRHTFTDKYQAASVPQNIGEYIMGHKSKQSNKIHAEYGTGRNVKDLVKHIEAIITVKEWGYFEEYDD
ncbi:MAG: hypothetical protein CNE96_09135 [Rhodobacteraceae bacterium MED-G08]|nr:hypothetical protein [Marinovum sp.]PDH58772.1 MAG: hypothetical protein CNE96_09135 [Rhodobacteraceae bacterium MED-G08]